MAKDEKIELDLTCLKRLLSIGYGYTVSYDGELHVLIAGDMGYEGSGVKLVDLVAAALERQVRLDGILALLVHKCVRGIDQHKEELKESENDGSTTSATAPSAASERQGS